MKMPSIILIICVTLVSCTKENLHRPYSNLAVRYLGDEEDISMETVEGEWDFIHHTATLTARGYKFETFGLSLPQISTIGVYPSISIANISLSDGLDFQPVRLTGGWISVTYFDSVSVRGEFRVSLEDDFNGIDNKTIVGGFGIYK